MGLVLVRKPNRLGPCSGLLASLSHRAPPPPELFWTYGFSGVLMINVIGYAVPIA